MNSNNNAQVLKRKGNASKEFVTMQSASAVGYTPTSLPGDPMSASQSLYPQSYNFPTYDAAPSLPNPYSRDSMFSASVASTTPSSLPFGDITPPLFGSGMLGTHPYSAQGLLPSRTAPGLLNYGQSGMQASQPHLFPGASPYGGYPTPLSMPLHPGQSMDRYLLSNPAHMMQRFPGLHPCPPGANPLGGFRESSGVRPPFSASLLSDRKPASHSPLTNVSNGNELESRGDINGSRKKRKACGHCGPCQRKENCGSCMNCVNRAKGKQICIHRKCEILKKKPGSTPYTPAHVDPPIVKQEKRKEIDNFSPNEPKRSKLEPQAPQGGELPQGLLHPTLHPNFAEFGDLDRTPTVQQTGQPNTVLEQSGQPYQPRLTVSSDRQQADLRPTFFSENSQQQQQQSQQQLQQQVQQQQPNFPANNRSREPTTDAQPVNEESDFINQALQAIESNITCNPSPEGNNSLSDTSNTALSASTPSQDQSQNPLQSPQPPRRVSVQDPSFNSWTPELLKPKLEPSSQMPAQASVQSATGSPRQAQTQQGLPDQLLNNLRKFNSPTSFHGQQHGSPVKDATKMGQFPSQQPQYGQNTHRVSIDNQQPIAAPKIEPNFSQQLQHQGRQYPQGQTTNSNQYPGDMPFIKPSEPNSRVPSYDQSNPASYNQMFSMNPAQRSYEAQSYPNNPAYSQARPTNARFPYEDYGSKQQTINSVSPGQYPYPQPHVRASYPNPGIPPQHSQTQFNLSQPQNQYHRYPNPQFNPRVTNPEGHRLPNGQWVPQQQTSPQQQGISPQQTGSQPPMYHTSNRRTSTNQQPNYPPPRQMTNQPGSNPTSNQSSLTPHPSNPAHSPYSGSVGSSLRSPAAIVTPSPVSQHRSESSSANMPHLASSPMATNPLCPTGVTTQSMITGGDSAYQHGLQSYRPWHEPDKPGISYHGHVSHTVVPPDGYKPDPTNRNLNVNHFLAQPGSSPNYPPPRPMGHLGQGGFPGDPSLPFAAARSSHPPGNRAETTQGYTSAHQSFAETMNSVLYGHPPLLKTHENSLGSISADKSTAESSPADPHSTISPGESGYDSAELSSVVSENLSHMSQKSSSDRSKNLCEAPVGSIVQQTSQLGAGSSPSMTPMKAIDEDATVSSGALLPTGAKVTHSHLSSEVHSGSLTSEVRSGSLNSSAITSSNLPQTKSGNSTLANISNQSKRNELNSRCKQRSFSLDCSQTLTKSDDCDSDFEPSDNDDQSDVTHRKVVSLRRFSSQGIGVSEGLKSNNVFKVPENFKTQKQVCNKTDRDKFANKMNPSSEENIKLNYATDTSAPIQHLNQDFAFDTPPQTPTHSRKSSFENVNGQKTLQTYTFAKTDSQTYAKNYMHQPQGVMMNHFDQSLNGMDFRGRVIDVKGQNGAIIKKGVFPTCNCIPGTDGLNDDAPYYTHLGAAPNIAGIRKLFESRLGYTGKALRIEKVTPTDKEGKTSHGCPVAKWIIRRESAEEKVLVVCRERKGHFCPMAVTVLIILLWDGLTSEDANFAYDKYKELVPQHGQPTDRRCATNEERTCACQGFNEENGGASFSFGCSWSMYYNGCKYARSVNPNKFKLNGTKNPEAESDLTNFCQRLSSLMSVLYKKSAPDGHRNQTEHENEGYECRLGHNSPAEGRPFSGCTCCMDFCAHAHKDQHNMENGVTIVLTLTKPENREIGKKPADEQLHVLPLYKLDLTNEDGGLQGVGEKLKKGSIEILSSFRREVRLRDKPLGNCKQRTNKKRKGETGTTVKKRGRKPKRSLSMENLFLSSQKTPLQPAFHMNLQTPPVYNQQWNHTHHPLIGQNRNYGHDPISSPPPRWPYRRHISTELDSSGPLSTESNLPSIGSIFSPGGSQPMTPTRSHSVAPIGLTPPSTPANFPMSPSPQNFQFGRRISTQSVGSDHNLSSPLPSLGGNNHPFTGSSANIRPVLPTYNKPLTTNLFMNQHGVMNPLVRMNHSQPLINHPGMVHNHFIQNQHPNSMHQPQNQVTPESHKLNLKSYAATQIKNENLANHPGYFPPQLYPYPTNEPPKTTSIKHEVICDSEESFLDTEMGGVALAPGHGSVLIECAKRELHATTSLMKPDRFNPSRISLVFYQHKNLNHRNHGAAQYSAKEAKRNIEKAEKLKKEKEEKERLEMENMKAQQQSMMLQSYQQPSPYLNAFYQQQHHGQIPLPSLNMSANIFQPRISAPITSPTNAPPRTAGHVNAPQSGVVTTTPALAMPGTCAMQSVAQRWSHPPNVSRSILSEKSFPSSANTRHVLQQSLVHRQEMMNTQQSQPSSEPLPTNQTQNNTISSNAKPSPILGQFSCYSQNRIYQQQQFPNRCIPPNQNFYPNLPRYPNHLIQPRPTNPQTLPAPLFLPPKHNEIP